eukprot:scaffold65899_cov35-Tisochrysis_lutea.AAC.1
MSSTACTSCRIGWGPLTCEGVRNRSLYRTLLWLICHNTAIHVLNLTQQLPACEGLWRDMLACSLKAVHYCQRSRQHGTAQPLTARLHPQSWEHTAWVASTGWASCSSQC